MYQTWYGGHEVFGVQDDETRIEIRRNVPWTDMEMSVLYHVYIREVTITKSKRSKGARTVCCMDNTISYWQLLHLPTEEKNKEDTNVVES